VSGFVIERNELPTAVRNEGNASIEHGWARAFVGARAFMRRTQTLTDRSFNPAADNRTLGGGGYLNVILNRRFTVFADEQLIRTRTPNFDQFDTRFRVGLNFVHPRGIFAQVSTSHYTQSFSNTPVTELPNSTYPLTDAAITYEFAAKRGELNVGVWNLFDRKFQTIVEGLSVDPPLPDRRVLARLRWRL
jgi:hypothetical protein